MLLRTKNFDIIRGLAEPFESKYTQCIDIEFLGLRQYRGAPEWHSWLDLKFQGYAKVNFLNIRRIGIQVLQFEHAILNIYPSSF
jgi:hypothetical protein